VTAVLALLPSLARYAPWALLATLAAIVVALWRSRSALALELDLERGRTTSALLEVRTEREAHAVTALALRESRAALDGCLHRADAESDRAAKIEADLESCRAARRLEAGVAADDPDASADRRRDLEDLLAGPKHPPPAPPLTGGTER
jgi:hypothetical protein